MPKLQKPLGDISDPSGAGQQQPTAGSVPARVNRKKPSRVFRYRLSVTRQRALWTAVASLTLALVEAAVRFTRSLK